MDVTSQLNLEREAGMGENTERRPKEPASAGGGRGASRAQARGAEGVRASPGGGPAPLPPPCPAASLASPPPHTQRWSCTSSPSKCMSFCFPQKNSTPQNSNQRQQIHQIESQNVLDDARVAYQKED